MAKKLWGGRFGKKTDPLVEDFTRSIQYDFRLAPYDIVGSRAHIRILRRAGILTARELARLDRALAALARELDGAAHPPNRTDEDIHSYIQNELERRAGAVALKLHTARSRNDQVVFATKLYAVTALRKAAAGCAALAAAFRTLGASVADIVIPGMTHLQHAQPVRLRDHLGAYAAMCDRDSARLTALAGGIRLTMGSGALAGTPIEARHYAIDITALVREGTGERSRVRVYPARNSLDAVSDRDFVIETVAAVAIAATHLSRSAEDLILWSSKEFAFASLDDAFCTGSSLMPQKKNPDVLELIRGYAGRAHGNLVAVLAMMKGLPLTYNRDMQLDKEPLFASLDLIIAETRVLARLVRGLAFDRRRIAAALDDESLYATDIAYDLVARGVPFKTAHERVGALVRRSLDEDTPIREMSEETIRRVLGGGISKDALMRYFDPVFSVRSKRSVRR